MERDPQQFERTFREHHDAVLAYALRRTSEADARDVVAGEILRNHGAGIDAYARDIPLPPGGSFDDLKARMAAGEAAEQSATGLRASMEFVATCQWTGSWLAASARGDSDRMARAVRVLRDARNWPATTAVTSPGDEPTHLTVANAAARGDAATVRRIHRANC